MEPLIRGDKIQLYLPYGDVGFFQQKQSEQILHDNYVLTLASELLNDCDKSTIDVQSECRDAFFEGLQRQIKLEAGFKTLSHVTTRQRRDKTKDARLLCLFFLSSWIKEMHICKDIVVLAKLW